MATPESRQFSVAPNIIYSLIHAQAGSLGKAILEGVMNAVDAGASEVAIDLDRKGVVIRDNGRGFQTRKEIEDWFDVFGFDHMPDDHRKFGKFGIGRAQLWSFASTIWRTNTFAMDVDIKRRGLDYTLTDNLPHEAGLTITGSFYEPITTGDIQATERELADLCQYTPIPVLVNGKRISKEAAAETWDFETDDAWIRIRPNGDLSVFNLGVLVRKYGAYRFGVGGVVVTKPGVQLALNMARNDVLESECKVWKRIKPFLQSISDNRVKAKAAKLTEPQIENMARRFLAGEIAVRDFLTQKIIQPITGRPISLNDLRHRKETIYVASPDNVLAERAHQRKLAYVLSDVVLTRFGVGSLAELVQSLTECCGDAQEVRWAPFTKMKINDDLSVLTQSILDTHERLVDADVKNANDRVTLSILRQMSRAVLHRMIDAELIDRSQRCKQRKIFAGKSEAAHAWTDGQTYIVFDLKTLQLGRKGLAGYQTLLSIMVHEYLHHEADTGSHRHDHDFYEAFHNFIASPDNHDFHALSGMAFRRHIRQLKDKGLEIPKSLWQQVEFHVDMMDDAIEA